MTAYAAEVKRQRALARWLALPGNVRGAVWMLCSGILFTCMGVLVKHLSEVLDPMQIAFFRCLFGTILLIPVVMRLGPRVLYTKRPVMHLVRGLLGVTAMACMFYALANLPLAEVTVISFGKPLFLIFLAALFLGEAVRWRRGTATVIGFIGVIVIMRPGVGELEWAALVALGGTCCIAVVTVIVKKLTVTDAPITLLVWFGIISSAVLLVPAILVWQMPTWSEFGLLVLVGGLGASAQACIVRAYRVGQATAVAPFDYFRLIHATVFGILLFGDWPDLWTIAGAAIIVTSTLYIAYREARLGKEGRMISPPEDGGSAARVAHAIALREEEERRKADADSSPPSPAKAAE